LQQTKRKIRPIAIHLPQYHPIAENDEWWGKGFTEWTNVVKSKPLFPGHYQPQLPADLGFYDLRLFESIEAQARLAEEYGIHGFCFYHYWFNGKKLLERPIEEILSNKKPNFPFMLCWANENWSRRWDGLDKEVLIEQKYSEEDDEEHIEYLIEFFKDPRYIKVNGKPIFIVYKPHLLPHPQKTLALWRKKSAEHGLDLHICHMVFNYIDGWDKLIDGFDAAIDFEPFGIRRNHTHLKRVSYIFNKEKISFLKKVSNKLLGQKNYFKVPDKYNLFEYSSMFESLKPLSEFNFKIYPMLVPGWDNSPRRKDNPSLILHESDPYKFSIWLDKIIADIEIKPSDENLIFINAWNEWGEGNHLEPCTKWGCQFLETIKKKI
jgi:hypothetical protein